MNHGSSRIETPSTEYVVCLVLTMKMFGRAAANLYNLKGELVREIHTRSGNKPYDIEVTKKRGSSLYR